jgi:hypothetical protein
VSKHDNPVTSLTCTVYVLPLRGEFPEHMKASTVTRLTPLACNDLSLAALLMAKPYFRSGYRKYLWTGAVLINVKKPL